MKIVDLLSSGKPSVSFEIFPPKRPAPSLFGDAEEMRAMEKTKAVVREIAALKPTFISVTYGAAGGTTGANTAKIAEYVQDTCGIPALAHLTCITSSRDRIADELKSFREKKIENILCLRGDFPNSGLQPPTSNLLSPTPSISCARSVPRPSVSAARAIPSGIPSARIWRRTSRT